MEKMMARYREMTVTYLQKTDPQDLERMRREGTLEEFLKGMEADYANIEKTVYKQMTEDLPADPIKRAQTIDRARTVAREAATSQLSEFLESLDPS
jgi:hypothetical protein